MTAERVFMLELGWFTGIKTLKILSGDPRGAEPSGALGWDEWVLPQHGTGAGGEGEVSGTA